MSAPENADPDVVSVFYRLDDGEHAVTGWGADQTVLQLPEGAVEITAAEYSSGQLTVQELIDQYVAQQEGP